MVTFDRQRSASLFTFNFVRLIALLYLLYAVPRSALTLAAAAPGAKAGAGAGAVQRGVGVGVGSLGLLGKGGALSYDHVLALLDGETSLLLSALATGFTVFEAITARSARGL